jgi:hypothetical protein
MRIGKYILPFTLVVLVTCFVAGRQSEAALGESAALPGADKQELSVRQYPATAYGRYTVRETKSASSVIREYASPAGVVFAIAWNGRVHPDLTQILGVYDTEYKDALSHVVRKPGSRRAFKLSTPQIVVEKWGHMRDQHGRAYVTSMVPSGVNIDDLK